MKNILSAYIPQDRYRSLLRGESLPTITQGAALFADISGFTSLTERLSLELGTRRGIEELTRQINAVYQALIAEIERFGGSVINFAGDSVTCWFDDRDGQSAPRAVTCAQQMQQAMKTFEQLALKIAITYGQVRRLAVGNPDINLVDTLAGATVARLALGEHLTKQGEVLLDENTLQVLGESITTREWRSADSGERFAVLSSLNMPSLPTAIENPTGAIVNEVLKSWIPPSVFEREQSGFSAFLTELRPAVALFLHFSGIDYDRDDLAGEKLDTFIRRVQAILQRFEGNMLQLTIGDKGSYVYASFGVPITHEDDAQRAVQAAWALSQLPQELSYLEPLQIGLSKGTMRAGPYGGPTRLTYGALGDDTNLAARLMTAAAPGEILVSSRVYKLIAETFSCEPRPPLALKGKAEPLPVFAITSLRRQRSIRLEEPTYTLPMIGRQAELEIIRQKLDLTLQGHGQVIGIIAEAGMGKSRLVAEVLRQAYRSGFTGYGGVCQASGLNTGYLVWRSIWQAIFNIDLASSQRRQYRNLEVEIEDRAPAHTQAIPVLSPLLDISLEENEFTRTLEPKDRRNVLTTLLEECLKSSAGEEPHLLVLEDIHWIDPLSQDLLINLARVCMSLPVCILVTYRPSEAIHLRKERIEALAHFTRLNLAPLNAAEAEQMIRAKLVQLYPEQVASLPKSLAEELSQRADGNPFYLEELMNYLRDRGLNPYAISNLQSLDLPSSLQTLILSRIDQLTEAEKITLKVASIIGRLFQVTWLLGYYPSLGQEAPVKTNLAEITRIDLTILDSPEPELAYLFKHILTRDVVYDSMAHATRVQLHEQLAQFLETLDEKRFLDLIAYHYGLSENVNKQKEYFQKAGDAAKAAYANAAALEYYQRLEPLLSEPLEQINLHLQWGAVLGFIGQWKQAEAHYRAALAVSTFDPASQANCHFYLGTICSKRGDHAAALEWLTQARKTWERLQDSTGIAKALIEISIVLTDQGDYEAAWKNLNQALANAREARDGQLTVRALNSLGLLAQHQGDEATAEAYYGAGLELARTLGDKMGIAMTLMNLGNVSDIQGNYPLAQSRFEESLAGFRQIGNKQAVSMALGNLGMLAMAQDDYTTAKAQFTESITVFRELGDVRSIAMSLQNLGLLSYRQGSYAEARSFLREGITLYREVNDRPDIAGSLMGLASVAFHEGEHIWAVRVAAAAESLRAALQYTPEPPEAQLYAEALAALRTALGEGAFQVAWAEGLVLTLEEAIALALSPTPYASP